MQLERKQLSDNDLDAEEFLKITRMTPEARIEFFVPYVQSHKKIWGLFGEKGWIMVESGDELCLPVWPNQDFVTAWERDDFPNCEPKAIDLEDFNNQWAEGLTKNNTLLLLFPCGEEEEGIVMSGEELKECLEYGL